MKVAISSLLWLAASVMLVGSCGDQSTAHEPDEALETPGWAVAGSSCTANSQCDDGNPCTVDKCTKRKCAYTNRSDGASCTDGDSCTKGDACRSGQCVPGPAVVCPLPNQCQTSQGCNSRSGKCQYAAKDGAPCDDGNPCTENDKCTAASAGVCRGTRRVSALNLSEASGCKDAGVADASQDASEGGASQPDASTSLDSPEASSTVDASTARSYFAHYCEVLEKCSPGALTLVFGSRDACVDTLGQRGSLGLPSKSR